MLANTNAIASPIPEQMPISIMDQYKGSEIEDIGEPITACFLTSTDKDPRNWYRGVLSSIVVTVTKGGSLKSTMG